MSAEIPFVKLLVVTLHRDPALLERAISALQVEWGNTDIISADFPFTASDYYAQEMGTDLMRRFYSFETLVTPEKLLDLKLMCNNLEAELAEDGRRRVNLDPGYVDHYKLVLASNKFGGQKIYLRNGVYADMTLVMYKGKWESFAWGFPDFKSGQYDEILSGMRDSYKQQIKSSVKPS